MHKFLLFPFAEYVLLLGNHESLPFLADSYEKKEFKFKYITLGVLVKHVLFFYILYSSRFPLFLNFPAQQIYRKIKFSHRRKTKPVQNNSGHQ